MRHLTPDEKEAYQLLDDFMDWTASARRLGFEYQQRGRAYVKWVRLYKEFPGLLPKRNLTHARVSLRLSKQDWYHNLDVEFAFGAPAARDGVVYERALGHMHYQRDEGLRAAFQHLDEVLHTIETFSFGSYDYLAGYVGSCLRHSSIVSRAIDSARYLRKHAAKPKIKQKRCVRKHHARH